MKYIGKQPFIVTLAMISSIAMYVPMIHAGWQENWPVARTFLYHGTFLLILSVMVAIATSTRKRQHSQRFPLLEVSLSFLVLPLMLGMPLAHLSPSTRLLDAYFEMLACLTTTGATLFPDPQLLPESLHLWRSLVAWLGGLLVLVVAFAVFAPLGIGGFEMQNVSRSIHQPGEEIAASDMSKRLARHLRRIAPVYFGVTILLAVALALAGDRTFVALSHSMAVISTSGISPVGGLGGSASGILGEVFVFLFLVLAVSRHSQTFDRDLRNWRSFKRDKEINLALACVFVIPLFMLLRFVFLVAESGSRPDPESLLAVLWGSVFTVMSFLTTTGFESSLWGSENTLFDVGTTGLVLMGLASMGGGVATTAGGIKLLRVYAVYKHGRRELTRLSHPSSVGGAGERARMIRRQGAYVAWVFMVLFFMALAAATLALTATGLGFEESLALAVASLSNTAPIASIQNTGPIGYLDITDPAMLVLGITMMVGRLEVLAVLSLLSPSYWWR